MKSKFLLLFLSAAFSCTVQAQNYGTLFAIVSKPVEFGQNGREHQMGLYATTVQRPSWNRLSWPQMPLRAAVVSRASSTPKLLIGGETGILQPFPNQTGWQLMTDWQVTGILSLAIDPRRATTIYAGTVSGFFASEDFGQTWQPRNKNLKNRFVSCILPDAENPGRIIIGTELGLYESMNHGKDWTLLALQDVAIRSILREPDSWPGILWVGTEYEGLYESYDGGQTFEFVEMEDERISVYALAGGGANQPIYAGVFEHGLYRSASPGEIWEPVAGSEELGTIYCILPVKDSDIIYAGTHKGGVYRSPDKGSSWQPFGLEGTSVRALVVGDFHWAKP